MPPVVCVGQRSIGPKSVAGVDKMLQYPDSRRQRSRVAVPGYRAAAVAALNPVGSAPPPFVCVQTPPARSPPRGINRAAALADVRAAPRHHAAFDGARAGPETTRPPSAPVPVHE